MEPPSLAKELRKLLLYSPEQKFRSKTDRLTGRASNLDRKWAWFISIVGVASKKFLRAIL